MRLVLLLHPRGTEKAPEKATIYNDIEAKYKINVQAMASMVKTLLSKRESELE